MQNTDLMLQIGAMINTLLLAACGFFLRSLYANFTSLEKDVKESLIHNASTNQRIIALERDLENIKNLMYKVLLPHQQLPHL